MLEQKYGIRCLLVLGLLHSLQSCAAFAPSQRVRSGHLSATYDAVVTSLNMAKKKRRRRKDGKKAPQAETPSTPSASDDLPDFDLPEDIVDSSSDLPEFDLEEDGDIKPTQASSKKVDPDTITDAMMGSTDAPVRSINELIQDRKLEKVRSRYASSATSWTFVLFYSHVPCASRHLYLKKLATTRYLILLS